MGFQTISLDQRVTAGLDGLGPSERGEVMAALHDLLDYPAPSKSRLTPELHPVSKADPRLVIETPSRIVVIVSLDRSNGVVRAHDLMRREAIDEYSRLLTAGGHAKGA